jgi:hypothetical protein
VPCGEKQMRPNHRRTAHEILRPYGEEEFSYGALRVGRVEER